MLSISTENVVQMGTTNKVAVVCGGMLDWKLAIQGNAFSG